MLQDVVKRIHWLGHDAFRIDGTPTIYFDPWKLKSFPPADLILVSHDHFDHYSKEDIEKIQQSGTVVISIPKVAAQLTGDARGVKPGDTIAVKGVTVEIVAAYNLNKFREPGKPFHPKESQFVGFVVTVDGVRVYHSGDSDFTPEMAAVKADVALLPVSGKYVMTADEAVEAAKVIKPKIAIPMHFADIVGSAADAEKFQREAPVEVRILKQE